MYFFIDIEGCIRGPTSPSLASLLGPGGHDGRQLESVLGPLISAKALAAVSTALKQLYARGEASAVGTIFDDLEVRRPGQARSEWAHYRLEFHAISDVDPSLRWQVRIEDITAQVTMARELEDLKAQSRAQTEILRIVLRVGAAPFAAFLRRTEASMNTIHQVLKRPAREADAFRSKLIETLNEVARVRQHATDFGCSALNEAACIVEQALMSLERRPASSGSDFLPLAVKLDQLHAQFILLCTTLESARAPAISTPEASVSPPTASTASSTVASTTASHSLHGTLVTLTEHIAHESNADIQLDCRGLERVPVSYQALVKNVAIQMIRNSVMHGIESTPARLAAGKPPRGRLRLEFKLRADAGFDLCFGDDGSGLDARTVRDRAVARGLISGETASRLRDRDAIKLIFRSGYSTLDSAPGQSGHGRGLSLVRRYVHEAGGRIALASRAGRETRFKITLPAIADSDTRAA